MFLSERFVTLAAMGTLKDRYGDWALVVGATSGIGRALTDQLADAGLNVVTVARTEETLERQAEALRAAHGVEVVPVVADLARIDGVAAVIAGVGELEIDVLVPCAATEGGGYFVEGSTEAQQRMLQMNCAAPTQLVQHFGAAMAKRRRGAILLVSSLSGWTGQPYMAQYGASKAYILSLGEGLYREMKDLGVDVAVLSPGPTDTPMAAATGIDFAKMSMKVMDPTDVAAAGLAALGRRRERDPRGAQQDDGDHHDSPHAAPGRRRDVPQDDGASTPHLSTGRMTKPSQQVTTVATARNEGTTVRFSTQHHHVTLTT